MKNVYINIAIGWYKKVENCMSRAWKARIQCICVINIYIYIYIYIYTVKPHLAVTLGKRSPTIRWSVGTVPSICQYATLLLVPVERSLVNSNNGHYYAVPTAYMRNKCNSLIMVSVKNVVCTATIREFGACLRQLDVHITCNCTEFPVQGQPHD